VCFDVLVFDPKKKLPLTTAVIAPIVPIGSNLIVPSVVAKTSQPQT